MRAYQARIYLPVAMRHASVVIGPGTGVGTSADAIGGLILTSRRVRHGFSRWVEERCDADEGHREEKLPCHIRTSWERRPGHSKS
jgi:hypothetical protein